MDPFEVFSYWDSKENQLQLTLTLTLTSKSTFKAMLRKGVGVHIAPWSHCTNKNVLRETVKNACMTRPRSVCDVSTVMFFINVHCHFTALNRRYWFSVAKSCESHNLLYWCRSNM